MLKQVYKAAERKRVQVRNRPLSATLPTSDNSTNHSAVLAVLYSSFIITILRADYG